MPFLSAFFAPILFNTIFKSDKSKIQVIYINVIVRTFDIISIEFD